MYYCTHSQPLPKNLNSPELSQPPPSPENLSNPPTRNLENRASHKKP